jgi:hypothetical protein
VDKDGSASSTDIEREKPSGSKMRRAIQPVAPAPRDSDGLRKRAEEREAVKALLPNYNKLHGTSYESVVSGEDSRGDDVIAQSVKECEPPMQFQVTFADNDGSLRASIARGMPYALEESEEELLARAVGALRKKKLAPDRDTILVLDGAGIITPPGIIDRFVREHHGELGAAPFREVWWVDHAIGGVARRLWPVS